VEEEDNSEDEFVLQAGKSAEEDGEQSLNDEVDAATNTEEDHIPVPDGKDLQIMADIEACPNATPSAFNMPKVRL
ncbi:hypothetical protein, partial [Sporisorium scitamineum]